MRHISNATLERLTSCLPKSVCHQDRMLRLLRLMTREPDVIAGLRKQGDSLGPGSVGRHQAIIWLRLHRRLNGWNCTRVLELQQLMHTSGSCLIIAHAHQHKMHISSCTLAAHAHQHVMHMSRPCISAAHAHQRLPRCLLPSRFSLC